MEMIESSGHFEKIQKEYPMKPLLLNQDSANTLALKTIITHILDGGDMETARQDFRTQLTTMTLDELVHTAQQLEEKLGEESILIAENRLKDFLPAELLEAGTIKKNRQLSPRPSDSKLC